MFYWLYKPIIRMLIVSAGGVVIVMGLSVLLFADPVGTLGPSRIAVILLGIFSYIFFIQHQAFQKHRLDEKKLEQEKMLREVSGGLFDNILEADITENKIMGTNAPRLASLLGIESHENYDEIICAIVDQLVRADFRDEYIKLFSREKIINLCNDNKFGFEYEFIERSDGINYTWVKVFVRIYRAFDTGAVRIISHVKNIQQEKERELANISKAQRDPLTNLYNKVVTKELIDELLISEDGKGTHALYLIDIDNFKAINDNFGHAFGDVVISTMANNLSHSFRNFDIVGRIGGDEFLILMKDVTDRSVIFQKAEEICKNFHDLFKNINGKVTMSLSIGICILPEDGLSFDELYKKADAALYVSKNNGKDTFTFYDTP